jgi:hypothetical protein
MTTTYSLARQQFSSVIASSGSDRYKHFVNRVADWESVWGLRNDSGWVSVGDDMDNSGFPVWPHPDYATACAIGDWEGNSPTSINVHDFVESWLPKMAADGVKIAVFPTPALSGVFVLALELQASIKGELAKID